MIVTLMLLIGVTLAILMSDNLIVRFSVRYNTVLNQTRNFFLRVISFALVLLG